jgi:hypothetical protein
MPRLRRVPHAPRRAVCTGLAMAVLGLSGCGVNSAWPAGDGTTSRPTAVSTVVTPPLRLSAAADTRQQQHRKGRFAWVEWYEAVCVDLVHTTHPTKALRRLTRGRAKRFASRRAAEHWVDSSPDYDRFWIATGRLGKWSFLWEDNGYFGSLHKPARRVSAHTSLISVYWNVEALESFTYAVHGRIVRQFDPLFYHQRGIGTPLPAEKPLHWYRHPEVAMLNLQSALTGHQPAHPSWLKKPGVTYWGVTQ